MIASRPGCARARWPSVSRSCGPRLFITLPQAIRGIITGVLLAISRAAGETAPILVVGAILATNVPAQPESTPSAAAPRCSPSSSTAASPRASASRRNASGRIGLVLLAIVLAFNVSALLLRACDPGETREGSAQMAVNQTCLMHASRCADRHEQPAPEATVDAAGLRRSDSDQPCDWTSRRVLRHRSGRRGRLAWTSTQKRDGADRPSGCGKSTLLRCINRMNDLIPGVRSKVRSARRESTSTARCRPGASPPRSRDGLPEAEPVPEVDLRERRLRRQASTAPSGDMDELVERRSAGRALGRGQGQAGQTRLALSGGSSSGSASRACSRCSRSHPDGRAVLRPRPDRDAAHRGPDAGAAATTRS